MAKDDVRFNNNSFHSGLRPITEETHFSNAIRFIAILLNISFHINVLIITVSLCSTFWRIGLGKTAMHACFCTLGYILLVAEGINLRYSYNPLFWDFDLLTNVLIHTIMVTSGGLIAVAGTVKMYYSATIHFSSFHGQIGAASLMIILLNIVSGACYTSSRVVLDDLRLLHDFLGIVTFALGIYSQMTGYASGFFRRNFDRIRLYRALTLFVFITGLFHPFSALLDAVEKSILSWSPTLLNQ
uniref:ascorbate ferrireductase (transmembrane) n=1 Tax=Glossina brevipalpis TaxID=37001 RepID=A0A1A9W6U7_9MUSC